MSHDPIQTSGGNLVLQLGVVSTCTVPSGTPNLTDVDARLNLTNADVGSVLLLIMTGGTMLRTTVLSVADATHCTLADNAPLNSDASSNTTLFRKRGDPLISTATINQTLTAHDTCSFTFLDGLAAPLVRQPVLVTFQGDHLFGGTIDQVQATNLPGTSAIMSWACDAVSWDKVIYKRTTGEPTTVAGSPAIANPLSGTFTNQTVKQIMQYLITNALGSEGLAFTAIDGPVIPTFSVSYAPCGDAFDQLIVAGSDGVNNLHWYTDALKTVHLEQNGTVSAPWNISDADPTSLQAQITVTWDRSQYVNRVIIRLGSQISNPVDESFKGDGTSRVFTLQAPAAAAPIITLNGSPQTVGILGVDTGKNWYWNSNSSAITQDASGTTLTSSDTLAVTVSEFITGYAQYLNSTAVNESTSIESGTGYYETVQQQDNPLTMTDATTLAQAVAKLYGVIPKNIQISTYRPGLKIGQLINVSLAQFGINSNFVIDSVTISTSDNLVLWTVTAVGSPLTNWDYRAQLAKLRPPSSTGGSAGGAYIRTLDLNDSTVGNDIAPHVPIWIPGAAVRVIGVLRKTISSNLTIRVNLNGSPLITLTIPSTTPKDVPIQSTSFLANQLPDLGILTWDVTASDGQQDANGVATLTVQFG